MLELGGARSKKRFMSKDGMNENPATRGQARVKFAMRHRTYEKWLQRADDIDCLTLVWATHALQSGNARAAKSYVKFPKEAEMNGILGDYAVYPWELETFVTSLLTTRKDKPREKRHHRTDCKTFASIRFLTNTLRSLEGAEYVIRSNPEDIWEEMYRIGQRQFSWQRGPSSEELYRYAYVYGQGECDVFFNRNNGLSVSEFLFLSTVLTGFFLKKPWIELPDPTPFDLPQEKMQKALDLLSINLAEARKTATRQNSDAAQRLGRPLRTAYMPSLLRLSPIIHADRGRLTYIAPLPLLVMRRATAGLYYDIRKGPNHLLTEANARFENYVRSLIEAYLPELKAIKEAAYGPKGRQIDPPDCLVEDAGQIVLAIECKTTKLTFEAQYAENPMAAAHQGFEQIAKGIFQLWRFFSHARRQIYSGRSVSAEAIGLVLTMDGWMQMATSLREAAMKRAEEMASNDNDITKDDMRRVVFASVSELNETLALTERSEFSTVLAHATTDAYHGHGLPEIARNCGVETKRRRFPMKIEDLLPWWGKLGRYDDQQPNPA